MRAKSFVAIDVLVTLLEGVYKIQFVTKSVAKKSFCEALVHPGARAKTFMTNDGKTFVSHFVRCPTRSASLPLLVRGLA